MQEVFPSKGSYPRPPRAILDDDDHVSWLESRREIKIHPAVNYLEFHLWEERERESEREGKGGREG